MFDPDHDAYLADLHAHPEDETQVSDAIRDEIPAWVGGTGQYAIIHVQYEPGAGEAWPVVQRVPGGWQSGAHHYPDDAVLNVRPLTLVDPGDTRSIVQRVTDHLLTHAVDTADRDADGNCACVCGWREGEGWDDHLAEALADAGLLANDAERRERAAQMNDIIDAVPAADPTSGGEAQCRHPASHRCNRCATVNELLPPSV